MLAMLRVALCTISLITVGGVCQAIGVSNGLIHLWKLDEPGGTTAYDSIGNWHLQARGDVIFGCPGVNASGVLLDGDNDFLVSELGAAQFLNLDFTLSLWMRWDSVPGKPGILQFTSAGRISGLHIDLNLAIEPFVYLTSGALQIGSSRSINDGGWHLLSLVQKDHQQFLYLDAEQVGSGAATFTLIETQTFTLGKDDATHFFGGTLDEVAIYNRALTAGEIATNAVPEPSVLSLLGLSAVCLGFGVRRRRATSCLRFR